MLLSDYIYRTRRILRDANARFFTDQDLIIYVNLGRDRVVVDTVATRVKCFVTINPGQEAYTYATVLSAVQSLVPPVPARGIAAILNINYIWSVANQPPLKPMAWSDFNQVFRSNPVNSYPTAWAMYGLNQFYIQPTPPSVQQIEVDSIYLPTNLSQMGDSEFAIPDPISELVPLMAARWATYYEQDKARAEEYMAHYEIEKDQMLSAMPPFRSM